MGGSVNDLNRAMSPATIETRIDDDDDEEGVRDKRKEGSTRGSIRRESKVRNGKGGKKVTRKGRGSLSSADSEEEEEDYSMSDGSSYDSPIRSRERSRRIEEGEEVVRQELEKRIEELEEKLLVGVLRRVAIFVGRGQKQIEQIEQTAKTPQHRKFDRVGRGGQEVEE